MLPFVPANRRNGPIAVSRGNGNAKVAAAAKALKEIGAAIKRLPPRRRNGGGGGGQSGGSSRRNGRRPRRALQMPANVLYQERGGRSDFSAMTTKALQKQAWKYHPASSNLMAPRGLGYYDAFACNCSSAVTSMTIGPTTPITGITVIPRISTDYHLTGTPLVGQMKDTDAQLLIIGPSRGKCQARLWRASNKDITLQPVTTSESPVGGPLTPEEAEDFFASHIDFTCPQLESDQPIDGIPARCSVQIKNFSNSFARGGRVRVLRATTGRTLIPNLTTNGELWELMEGIRSHWRTATYDGEDFSGKGSTSMQKNCIVLDQTRTLKFQAFDIHKPLHESDLWWEIQRYKDQDPQTSSQHRFGAPVTGHDPAIQITDGVREHLEEEAANHDHTHVFIPSMGKDGGYQTVATGGVNPHNKQMPDIDAFTEYTANPTFTPIFILFEPCITGATNSIIGNEYEVKIASQFHCHFKQGSTLANMAKEPATSMNAVTSATKYEENLGSYLKRAAGAELKFQRQRASRMLFG